MTDNNYLAWGRSQYERLIKRRDDLVAEFRQTKRDGEYWNLINPTEEPLDMSWCDVEIEKLLSLKINPPSEPSNA